MRIFYGWIILGVALAVKLLKGPGQANVMGVIVPHLLVDLGLDSRGFGLVFAGATLTAATVQPLFGHCLDKFGARTCLPLGLLLLATGCVLISHASTPAMLFPAFVCMRATSIGCLESWTSALIALWFDRRRGRALAAMMVVSGLPTGIMADFVHIGDEAIGWRMTYQIAAACLCGLAGLAAATVRNRPADVGQCVDGDTIDAPRVASGALADLRALTSEAARDPTEVCVPMREDVERGDARAAGGDMKELLPSPTRQGHGDDPKAWEVVKAGEVAKAESDGRRHPTVAVGMSDTADVAEAAGLAAASVSPSGHESILTAPAAPPIGCSTTLVLLYVSCFVQTTIVRALHYHRRLFYATHLRLPHSTRVPSLLPPPSPSRSLAPARSIPHATCAQPSCAQGGGIDIFTGAIADEHGATTDVALTVFMPMGLVLSLCTILCGIALDRAVPPHLLLSAACALAAAATALATQLSDVYGALAYAIVRGVAHGLYFPVRAASGRSAAVRRRALTLTRGPKAGRLPTITSAL